MVQVSRSKCFHWSEAASPFRMPVQYAVTAETRELTGDLSNVELGGAEQVCCSNACLRHFVSAPARYLAGI